ncbi:MAG: hypothetical protein ACYDIA_02255 [Candidatus Humimicrobiaceae bacterium]
MVVDISSKKYDNLKMKRNRENIILNISGDDELKEIEEFKKKNKKYLAARHETDRHIKVTESVQRNLVLPRKPK